MKHNFDSYGLYKKEDRFSFTVRVRVTMKETVDPDILRTSVNKAIKRYPYFSVKVIVCDDGGFDLIYNDRDVVVIHTQKHIPALGTEEVNEHLLFIDYHNRCIYFNISHSLAGGRGFMPWVMTTIYQYVCDKYDVIPDAPGIIKPDSHLLPTETTEPALDMLTDESPIYEYKSKKPHVMLNDYMNGLLNPFKRYPNYRIVTVEQKDVVKCAKKYDMSVAALVFVAMSRAMDKVLPEKIQVIGGEIAHNPRDNMGIPDAHSDFLSHIHIDYERELIRSGDIRKLGMRTRGQMILQTDPTVSHPEIKKRLELYQGCDTVDGLKNKRKYMTQNDLSSGKDAEHGTFYINYTGQLDWGEVADYVENYVIIVEGHLMLEITSMADRLFVCFMQLIKEDKYVLAFKDILLEMGIPCKITKAHLKHLAKHGLV